MIKTVSEQPQEEAESTKLCEAAIRGIDNGRITVPDRLASSSKHADAYRDRRNSVKSLFEGSMEG